MSWHDKYIGLPFESQGRSRKGVDCWGLASLVYRDELGVELPGYGDISAHDLIRISRAMAADKEDAEKWQAVDAPREFDIVVMKFHGTSRVGHVGICCGRNHVLHVEQTTDAVAVSINHHTIAGRIDGYRRWRK